MAALEEAKQTPFGDLKASQLEHKHHDRSRTCNKSKIAFLLSRCKICGGCLSCKSWILHCFALNFDVIQRAPCGGHEIPSTGSAFEEAGLCIIIKLVRREPEVCIQLFPYNISPSFQTDTTSTQPTLVMGIAIPCLQATTFQEFWQCCLPAAVTTEEGFHSLTNYCPGQCPAFTIIPRFLDHAQW